MKTQIITKRDGHLPTVYEKFDTLKEAQSMLYNIWQTSIETDDNETIAGTISNRNKLLIMPNGTQYWIERAY